MRHICVIVVQRYFEVIKYGFTRILLLWRKLLCRAGRNFERASKVSYYFNMDCVSCEAS